MSVTDSEIVHLRLPKRLADKLDQLVEHMDDDADGARSSGKRGRPRAIRYLIARVHKELGLNSPPKPESTGG